MSKHTPGPWTLNKKNGRIIEFKGCKISVAASTPADSPVAWANAKLIAAAPEMLEALKAAYGMTSCYEGGMSDGINAQIKAAIAKAEGTP